MRGFCFMYIELLYIFIYVLLFSRDGQCAIIDNMAIDFPSSPSVGDTYTSGGRTFRWNGTTWDNYIDAAAAVTHAGNHASGGSDPVTVAQSQVTGLTTALSGKVDSTDARLTDARTPTAHAASHASAGSDAITIAQSQVTNLTTDLAAKASNADLALKAPLASPTFTGTVSLPSTTSIGNVSSTEIGYLDGVTGALQTQINLKSPIDNPTFTGELNANGAKVTSTGQFVGGFGAHETGGVSNWNDISNARPGNGYTLLLGSASNGPGSSNYYHPFSFEYYTKNGTGNMTQFAIGYNVNELWMRNRYGGTWTSWVRL